MIAAQNILDRKPCPLIRRRRMGYSNTSWVCSHALCELEEYARRKLKLVKQKKCLIVSLSISFPIPKKYKINFQCGKKLWLSINYCLSGKKGGQLPPMPPPPPSCASETCLKCNCLVMLLWSFPWVPLWLVSILQLDMSIYAVYMSIWNGCMSHDMIYSTSHNLFM